MTASEGHRLPAAIEPALPTLYYRPMACSLAARIALTEAGLGARYVAVDLVRKRTEEDEDFLGINPKGKVAALRLADGSVLTENIAVLLYIAAKATPGRLAPAPDSRAYFELLQWLAFISSELHKQCLYPVFRPDAGADARSLVREHLDRVLAILDRQLEAQAFLAGAAFSVADAYLLWGLMLAGPAGAELKGYPAVDAYYQRLRTRRSVVESLKAESGSSRSRSRETHT